MIVYKYFPAEPWAKNFFSDFRVRFTQPDALNDPFDCLPQIMDDNMGIAKSITREEYNRKLMGAPASEHDKIKTAWNAHCQKIVKAHEKQPHKLGLMEPLEIRRNISKKCGVFSASKCRNNILLWSHYAQNHRGFAVAMDTKHSFFKSNDSVNHHPRIHTVRYRRRRTKAWLSKAHFEPEIILTKSLDWKYEQEMRLLRPLDQASRSEIYDPAGYLVYEFDVPPECIRSVIFGFEASSKMEEEIAKKVKGNPKLKHAKIQQAEIDQKKYLVNIKPY